MSPGSWFQTVNTTWAKLHRIWNKDLWKLLIICRLSCPTQVYIVIMFLCLLYLTHIHKLLYERMNIMPLSVTQLCNLNSLSSVMYVCMYDRSVKFQCYIRQFTVNRIGTSGNAQKLAIKIVWLLSWDSAWKLQYLKKSKWHKFIQQLNVSIHYNDNFYILRSFDHVWINGM
jgi:hypothetical protein